MMRLTQPANGKRIAMSGTPGRGKDTNLWGTLNWLRPELFSSYWRWIETYYDVDKDGYGWKIGSMRPEMEAEFDAMLAPHMLRRTKAEVAPDLPPKQYGGTRLDPEDPASPVGVWLPMEGRQAELYRQMEKDSLAELEGGFVEAIGVLPEMTRLRQFAICGWKRRTGSDKLAPVATDSNKYDWVLQFCRERAAVGRKVVIASEFTEVINEFAAQLNNDGVANYTLTGETSDPERVRRVAAFQSDDDTTTAFLLNTHAGGVAVTLDAADDLVFLDETFIPDDQEQVEDRIHRISRIHNVTIWYLRSQGSIEEALCRIPAAREAILKARLDGPRGIKFARQLLEEFDGTTQEASDNAKAVRR
jgi:SNF2 family DNA or RNA helicase